MEIKDLQIRDWVMFPHGIDKIVDLTYIEGKGLCSSFAASATLFPVPIEQIKPIPLTPEILEKNGFEKEIVSGDTFFTLDDIVLENNHEFGFDFGRFYRDSEDGFVFVGIITIKYIHELQNTLRLCGIEKEITI